MMSVKHSIQQAVTDVTRRANRWACVQAFCWFLAAGLGAAMLTGGIDYALRVQDRGVRVILSLATWLVVGGAAYRWILPALRYPWTNMQVAHRIEHRWPGLQNRLTSSLEFLCQEEQDATAGSAALRRAVITQTEAELMNYDLRSTLHKRPLTRSLNVCGGMLVVLLVLVAWRPQDVARSTQRLLMPWAPREWPRMNRLAFVAPAVDSQVAKGSTVEFRVTDENGDLPQAVELDVVFEGDDPATARTYEMDFRGGEMTKSIDHVTQSFRYRVRGGDDDGREWRELTVIDPPRIKTVQLSIVPPAYTGWPHDSIRGNGQVLEGSVLGVSGTATLPMRAAALVTRDAENVETRWPLVIGAMGRTLSRKAESQPQWQATNSVTYWYELTGLEGVTSNQEDQWQLNVIPDHPPSILYRSPLPSEALAIAEIPVELVAKDDLAVQVVELRYLRSDDTAAGEQSIELYRGPDVPQTGAADLQEAAGPRLLGNEKAEQISYAFRLSDLAGLDADAILTVTAVARDYKGQEALTNSLRLRVVSEAKLLDGVAQRQSTLLAQLKQLMIRQRDVMEHTDEVRIEWSKDQPRDRINLDKMQAIDLNQRELQSRLVTREDALVEQIRVLRRELEVNELAATEVGQRLAGMEQTLLELQTQTLDPLQRLLTATVKRVQEADELESQAVVESLGDASDLQRQVVDRLEQLMDEQEVWDSLRQFSREAATLLEEQRSMAERLAATRLADANGATLGNVSPVERESFARRQSDLASRFDKLRLHMQQAVEHPDRRDADAIATLEDALDLANQEAIGGRMRQTARTIRDGQLGRAAAEQNELIDAMERLVQRLSRKGEGDSKGLAEKMRDAGAELGDLVEQQKGLRKKSEALRDETETEPNRQPNAEQLRRLEQLRRQREELAEQTKKLAERLKRLTSQQAAEKTEQASESMRQANQRQQAGDRQGASNADQQAEQQLQDAQEQLAAATRQEEQRLLDRQMARLEQLARGWREQQQALIVEAERLQQRHDEQNAWTPGQLESAGNLGRQQHVLAEDVTSRFELLDGSQVFLLALRSARNQMELAGNAVEKVVSEAEMPPVESDVTPALAQRVIPLQETALRRLDQVLVALEQETDAENPLENEQQEPTPTEPGDGGSPNGPQPNADAIRSIEELKLLKAMQEDLARRTLELDQVQLERGRLSEQEQQELRYLADEQGELFELVQELIRRAQQARPIDGQPTPEQDIPEQDIPEQDIPEQDADESLEDALERSLSPGRSESRGVSGIDRSIDQSIDRSTVHFDTQRTC